MFHESSRVDDSWQKQLFTSRQRWTTRDRITFWRVVKSWRLVIETLIHESSRVDDSWQKLLFMSHQEWMTRDRNICSRVVTHARLVTPTRTIRTCIAFTLFPIIHVYFYKLVYYSNNLFIFLVLFSLLSKFIQLFKRKVVSFPRIDMSFHIPTHLFTNTYFLHTY